MKKSKKFVLAGLVLLAITGLLALTGCKNDSVPPEATSGTETKPVTHTVTFTLAGDIVTLSTATDGATIQYKLGDQNWQDYTADTTISIAGYTTITARATKQGLNDSDVVEKTYLVVTFDANGGSEVAPQVVESGKAANNPTDPSNGDKVLAGWYTSADGGTTLADTAYNFDAPVEGDITLYAAWNGVGDDGNIVLWNKVIPKTSEVQVIPTAVDLSNLYKEGVDSEVFISDRGGEIQPFVMGQYEVTQQLYKAVMGSNPSSFTSNVAPGETQELRPVEQVSWYDAVVFCNELSELMGLEPVYIKGGTTDTSEWGEVPDRSDVTWFYAITSDNAKSGYRLPTEVEWELAARGGNKDAAPWKYTYAGSDTIDGVAWYFDNSDSKTHQVGTKAANRLGLYDMSGNVEEWCWEWASGVVDRRRVIRGGSWLNNDSDCAVSYNDSGYPHLSGNVQGFRLVRSAN